MIPTHSILYHILITVYTILAARKT